MYGYGNRGGYRRGGMTAPVKVGEELDVTIEAVGEKGDGIAKKSGFVLFVPNVKEGQQVRIRVTKVLRKVGFAEVVGEGAEAAEEAPMEEAPEEMPEPEPEPEPPAEDTEDFGEEATEEASVEETIEEVPAEEAPAEEPAEEEVTEEVSEEVEAPEPPAEEEKTE